jgi:hypothetical protein
LAQPITCGATVAVSYTDPSAANDVSAIQDLAGNDAASFSKRAVINNTKPTSDPLTFTPNAGTTLGSSDASASIGLDNQYMIVGDDESNVVRVYPRAGGAAVLEWDYGLDLPIGNNELDLETSTRMGNTLYFMSSLSNKKTGATDPNRAYIFEATVSGTGAATQFTMQHYRDDIKTQLVNWDKNNGHGLGANYFGFAASVNGVAPENVNGFSVEGMTSSPDGKYLWLGFRAPQTDTTSRSKALIVPVQLSDLFTAAQITPTDTNTTLTFGAPIELDLGGRGIRSINKVADGTGYLIVAGPAGSASADVTNDFRLYTWSGLANNAPTELDNSLDTLLATTKGSFESSVSPASTKPGTCVELIQDNGDTIWPGQTDASKKLAPESQQFQGNRVQLGTAFTQTIPPTIVSSVPDNGATNAAKTAPIVLSFDRGVVAGSGSFELKKASDDSTVASFAVGTASVQVAYNKVTLTPSAPLAADTHYYLEAAAGTIKDHHDNAWLGLVGSTAFTFKTAAPVYYDLAITEVNSNATGGDFFELYNYGTTPIDLSGWKWDDSAADFNDSNAATFTAGTVIQPGERLVVVQDTSDTAFRTAWNNLSSGIKTAAVGGPGLGKGDAVVVFDANGQVAAAMNYGATVLTASDGSAIAPATRSDGKAITGSNHAGSAVGATGNDKKSAVWDGVSPSSPAYKTAVAGELNAYAQTADAKSIGSPGQ